MKQRMTRGPAHTDAERRRTATAELAAQRTQGSVTVFLALSFAMIAALLLTIVESCRTVSERLFWQTAVDSSMESLFSQFHRPLWENYRIFGLQYRTDEDLSEEFYDS